MSSVETYYNEHGDLEAEDVEGNATRRGMPLKRGVKTRTRRGKRARKRGGATVMKVSEADVQKLVDYVEASPQISLKEMAKLPCETGVHL